MVRSLKKGPYIDEKLLKKRIAASARTTRKNGKEATAKIVDATGSFQR